MKQKGDPVTIYSRGAFKIEGTTEADRECMRLDNKRYWRYRMLIGIVSLLLALSGLLKTLLIYFK